LVRPDGTASAWIVTFGAAGCVGLAYFLAARLGLALRPQPAHMAVFWPASGIAAGVLIIAGRRAGLAVGLGVMVGSIAAIVLNKRGFISSALLGACNLGEVLLLSWLLSRWIERPFALRDLRGVVGFLAAALIAVTITGIGGAAILASSVRPYQVAWQTWLPSHLVGIVVVAPLLIVLDQLRRQTSSRAETLEALAPLTILALASLYAVSRPTASWLTFSETIVMLPPLLWLAARCQPAFAIVGACIASSAVICATTFGIGRFGDAAVPIMDRVYGAQAVVMTLMVSTLVLTALFAELKRSNEVLRNKEAGFRRLLDGLSAAIQTTDTAGRITYCNQAAVELWGKCPVLGKDTRHNLYRLYYPDGTPMPDDEQPCQVSLRERRIVRGQEAFLERADGKRFTIIPCPSPLFDEAGKFVGIVNLHLDISERKRAEARLAERNAQLDLAGKIARIGSFTYDQATERLQVSPGFAVMYGLPESTLEISREQWRALVHPDDLAQVDTLARRALVNGECELVLEFRILRHGEVRWIESRVLISYDQAGRPVRRIGAMIDVTERKLAEATLAEREAQLALAGKTGLVGGYAYNDDTEIAEISEGCAAILGCPEGTIKISRSEWLARVHPEDHEHIEARRSAAFRERRPNFSMEYRVIRPDGEVRWVETRASVLYNDDGRPQRVTGVDIDVTERKQAEQLLAEREAQLDLAHKAARVGYYTYDISARTMRFSRASAATYGLSRSTMELTAQQWLARVHRDDMQRLHAEQIRAFEERRGELINEFRFVRPGGEVRWIEARSLIAYDQAGRAERMTGVYIDVTERRKTEDHKSLLIAELDHRVKNVLACVAAVAHSTRECIRSADEFLEVLDGRINSLANTHALLSSSRWQGVSLAELVRGELAFCMKGDTTCIEGPDIVLTAEATQPVAMVLHELVTNAAKYGALSNGHGRVTVRWRRQANGGSGGKLVIEWRENGGPPVAAPNAPGYGTSVIRDLIPYELGGAVDYELAPEGARCRLEIPAKWLNT
jgi:PAS domain S-box-containing protein